MDPKKKFLLIRGHENNDNFDLDTDDLEDDDWTDYWEEDDEYPTRV